MRKSVEYIVWFPKRVELSQTSGVPDASYQVYIDNWYMGTIVKRNGEWIGHLNDKAWKELTIEDVRAMGEIIDEATKENDSR